MSKRLSVNLPEQALDALQLDPTGSLSSRLAEVALRHPVLVEHAIPDLTTPEWCVVFDALNGAHRVADIGSSGGSLGIEAIALSVADSTEAGEHWRVDCQALATRLQAMSPAQRIAVAEVARNFWLRKGADYRDWDEAVALAKRLRPLDDAAAS